MLRRRFHLARRWRITWWWRSSIARWWLIPGWLRRRNLASRGLIPRWLRRRNLAGWRLIPGWLGWSNLASRGLVPRWLRRRNQSRRIRWPPRIHRPIAALILRPLIRTRRLWDRCAGNVAAVVAGARHWRLHIRVAPGFRRVRNVRCPVLVQFRRSRLLSCWTASVRIAGLTGIVGLTVYRTRCRAHALLRCTWHIRHWRSSTLLISPRLICPWLPSTL
jgi:hypothetical protein